MKNEARYAGQLISGRPRRWKVLSVDPDVLLQVASAGQHEWIVTGDAIPDDARIVGELEQRYNAERRLIHLIIESAEFPEVHQGMTLEVLTPTFARTGPRTGPEALS